MTIPPGLSFLFRLVLPRILSSIAIFGALTVLSGQQPAFSAYSTWICLICAIFAHPVLFLVQTQCAEVLDNRRAAVLGAIQPPAVQGSSYELRSAIIQSFSHGYTGDCYFEWINQYGYTFRLKIYGETRLMTVEPEHIKLPNSRTSRKVEILNLLIKEEFILIELGPVTFDQLHSLLGLGVFNSDGERWKTHRNMTRPFFSRNRISDFDNFERHTENTISTIKARLAQGFPIDFQDVVARFTLDSATEFLFGKDVESLGANLPYPKSSPLANDPSILNHPSNVFVRAFMQGQIHTAFRARFGMLWPLKEIWSDKVSPYRQQVDEFVNPILEERKQNLAAEKPSDDDSEEETFLDHLIKHTADNQVIKDELVNILVAGRDTTASLLTFCIYVLTERPDITERLKLEVLEKVGPNARPTYKIISEMKFLRAFINETLRLYPAVPFDGRTTRSPVVLPQTETQPAYYIPAGVNVFLMHRRADLWGPDVLEFDPDRFLDERLHKYLTPNPFIFLPFNAGPRICLGQQFAYNETSYFLIKFLQAFTDFQIAWDVQPESSKPPASWKPAPGTTKGLDKVLHETHLTMNVKEALWVRMKDSNLA
ncbi:cytochrome P450 [Lentinula aff. lateritia]|uniref:Cytochrome P450 n=1 Tax=Lentinula aff. lateritia TaxID=2804960 RepID=A0ACC1TUP1_9AGAR|nr:cytochrome P450 [Lentinula aff. lateritia]